MLCRKAVYNGLSLELYTAFLHSIKLDKGSLAVEQSNYLTKIVNVYILYELYVGQEFLLIISNLRIAYVEQVI